MPQCATGTQSIAPHESERKIQGHVGDRVANIVRRVAGELGEEVKHVLGKSTMSFESQWSEVMCTKERGVKVLLALLLALRMEGCSSFDECLLQPGGSTRVDNCDVRFQGFGEEVENDIWFENFFCVLNGEAWVLFDRKGLLAREGDKAVLHHVVSLQLGRAAVHCMLKIKMALVA